jgi:hypothetical protein
MITTTTKLPRRMIALAGSILALLSGAAVQTASADDLRVYFKLDPRLTQSLQMGERFVSPDTFYTTVQRGTELTVEVEGRTLNVVGDKNDVPLSLIASDPASAKVAHGQGNRLKVKLRGCGTHGLQAVGHGQSKQLTVATICENGTIRAVISQ